MEIDNELQCLFSAFGNCTVRATPIDTVHQGLEIGFGVAVSKSMFAHGAEPDRLWLNLAYTLNDFRFDGDAQFGDNVLPGAPRHFLRAELLYKHPSGVFFGPNVEWVPQAYYVDSANTLKTEPYAIWGLKLGYDNGGPFSAYVEGRNLSDEAYIASASITDMANAGIAPVRAGHRPRRLRRHEVQVVKGTDDKRQRRCVTFLVVALLLATGALAAELLVVRSGSHPGAGAQDVGAAGCAALRRSRRRRGRLCDLGMGARGPEAAAHCCASCMAPGR